MPKTEPEYAALTDQQRLHILNLSGLLDAPPDEAFDRLTKLVARLLEVPVALVSLVDDHRQFFKSAVGLAEPWASRRETPLSHSFCQHVVGLSLPLIIPDARMHDLVKENLAIPDLGVIAYAGMPLTAPDGEVLGSLCAIDSQPREWDPAHLEILASLAAITSNEIHLRLELRATVDLTQELARKAQEATASNAAKSMFLATMSHELRTPLNAILGFSQILMEQTFGPVNARQERYLNNILTSGRHLLNLINQVLDLSKVAAGAWELELTSLQIKDVIDYVVTNTESLWSSKGLSLVLDLPVRLPELRADETALRQVLYNLLSNAIKFTEQGEITISVRVAGSLMKVSVRDSGAGIDPADHVRIFERFEQVRSAQKNPLVAPGTGLGLSLTRALVELHEGRIWVESKGVGQGGSEFSFELPLSGPSGLGVH